MKTKTLLFAAIGALLIPAISNANYCPQRELGRIGTETLSEWVSEKGEEVFSSQKIMSKADGKVVYQINVIGETLREFIRTYEYKCYFREFVNENKTEHTVRKILRITLADPSGKELPKFTVKKEEGRSQFFGLITIEEQGLKSIEGTFSTPCETFEVLTLTTCSKRNLTDIAH